MDYLQALLDMRKAIEKAREVCEPYYFDLLNKRLEKLARDATKAYLLAERHNSPNWEDLPQLLKESDTEN